MAAGSQSRPSATPAAAPESITCDCGRRGTSGYKYDDDPTSHYFDMWVCAHCGRPAPMYFAVLMAELEEEET